jgi:hypothetical protein
VHLSSDAWSHAAAVPRSARACSFLHVIGLAQQGCGSASRFNPRTRLFAERLSRLRTFLYVQASEFAHLPDRSYRCAYGAGQPRFLHPGISCFVASARAGYASRPIQAIDGVGTFTRPDSQPCRLLPFVNASSMPSRAAPHDSGPVWVASPSPYDSLIHYTSPV